jgi:hypothetical protein
MDPLGPKTQHVRDLLYNQSESAFCTSLTEAVRAFEWTGEISVFLLGAQPFASSAVAKKALPGSA